MVAMSIVSTASASSLMDALENGKASGVIQAYNFSKEGVAGQDNYDITTLGFDLSYETARINGFGAKATFQSSSSPWVDDAAEVGAKGDMWGDGAQLSEMYLSYKIDNTTAQIGRMYLATTLVSSSAGRVNTQAFQGATISNSDLPDTTVTLAYVNKYQNRTDGEGNIGTFEDIGGDGAYTISIKNQSIKDLTITAAYLDSVDTFTTTYLEAAYAFDNYGISTQYFNNKQEGDESSYLIGVQSTATFGAVDLLAAYVTVDDTAYVTPGIGGGSDIAYTWSEIFADQYIAGQDSYRLYAQYNVSKNGYIGTSYVYQDAPDSTTAYTALIGKYKFSGEFKGLSVYATYEIGSEDSDERGSRVKFNYTF
jgi:hypothetical protein